MEDIMVAKSQSIGTTLSSTISATLATTTDPVGGDPGEVLENWSSLIGIITAIVGNILIALALNVQRYAHTRLHRERIQLRQRARAALKRAQSGSSGNGGSYGTMSGNSHGSDHENGNRNRNGSGHTNSLTSSANQGQDDSGHNETEPLYESQQYNAIAAHGEGQEGTHNKPTSTYLKSPYWWLGQVLITLGEAGNFLAYGFAPASIVSPLGVVALVSNCIIAPVMFKERFRTRDFWGVVIAVTGVVDVVFSANQEETKLEPHDVWDAITTMEFEIYMGITVLLIMILMWASGKYGKRTSLIDLGLVGLFGGYTALATKGVSSMLSSTLWRAFATPVTYALIMILLFTAIMQIRYVNKALQRFDSTQVIPIQFVLFTLCVILGSAILYRDFEKSTARQAAAFVGGCLLTFFGVFLITSGRQQHSEDDEDPLSDIEGIGETIGMRGHEGSGQGIVQDLERPKPRSRRSSSKMSKVSFADAVRAGSSADKAVHSVTHHMTSEITPSLKVMDNQVPVLVENPWRQSWSSSASLSPAVRTLSAESAVTDSALATSSQLKVTTSLRDPISDPMHPIDRPTTPRQSGTTRPSNHRSKTFISPSPLSSTVTTVVKDAFLRESDNTQATKYSIGRLRSSIRAGLYFNDDDAAASGNALEYFTLPQSDSHLARPHPAQVIDDDEADEPTRRRSRSVSDAIGDFFRSRKKNKSDETPDSDIENGITEEAS